MIESESLDLLHAVQLDLLVKFDRICKEQNLVYFLDSGTALGAVRHGGFIPWDDDVDVGMPRDDYERLIAIGMKGLPDNLFLQTTETDPAYVMPFAKIRLGNTVFPDKGKNFKSLKYKGIYIDVFPFDKVPENSKQAVRRIKKSRFWYFVSVFSRREYPGKKIPQKVLSCLLQRLPDRIITKFRRYYDSYCMKYNSVETNIMTCFCWRISQRKTYLFKKGELLPTKRVLFEGKELKIMNNPHAYLTKMFGDYHILPPEEDRKAHLVGPFQV